jgi:Toprim-like
MFDTELDTFKKAIDLRTYAASQGFELDRKESWRGSAVMRHPNGEKIIVKLDQKDAHYVYFSVHNDRDNGSIIDFVQNRQNLSIGAVRKELRSWIGLPPTSVPSFIPLQATSRDRMKVEAAYSKTKDAPSHPYLEEIRSLPSSLLLSERFLGRVRIDGKGNAIFPHFDGEGLSGFEMKNKGFTGFSTGGTKGIWLSRSFPDDRTLVFSESAIDSLSHATLFPDDRARYASVGGKLNPQQPELIRAAIARMPVDSEIVSAMDADEDGRKLAEVVRKACELTGRGDLHFSVQEPFGFKDWNDQLRARPASQIPLRMEKPAVA